MTTSDLGRPRSVAFSTLIGLASLAVFFQAVWAGIFLDQDLKRGTAHTWVDVHLVGAYVAVVLALAAVAVAFVQLRIRRDLIIGAAIFAVLLIIETGLGSAIHSGSHALTAVHVPLAMAIMGLAVWLPLRVRTGS